MRILASSDLHYNIKRSQQPTRDLARRVIHRGGDVLILAGDIAGVDETVFLEALELFAPFTGRKLFVPGNHDLWVTNGLSSYDKWLKRLPALAQQADFSMLDHQSAILDRVGFVGNVGWYDYTFCDEGLAIPIRFYQAKIAPGRALRLNQCLAQLGPFSDLLPHHRDITTAWRDADFVKLNMSDNDFVELLIKKLQADLQALESCTEKIVAVIHHLPRRDLVWYRGDANWDFAAAFLGSQRFYDLLKNFPSLKMCLAGHNHRQEIVKDNQVEYITIGSTYLNKILLEFNL